jgi:hypothetical protein
MCIKTPGKFEGSALWAPWFWDRALEGFADEEKWRDDVTCDDPDCDAEMVAEHDSPLVSVFHLTDEDYFVWPELKTERERAVRIEMWEDEQGFVHCQAFTQKQADALDRD